MKRIHKIISGGQTGTDRAALDTAIDFGIPIGGWCPKGRTSEDGIIPDQYNLTETKSKHPTARTKANVKDSDATLIIAQGPLTGGTALTQRIAKEKYKPCLVTDPTDCSAVEIANAWLEDNEIKVLNIAGPRASNDPQIYELSCQFLRKMICSDD